MSPPHGRPCLALITGMSGAGCTTAAKVMEDLGWFVIDNIPPPLIEKVVDLATVQGSAIERLALVANARGRKAYTGHDAVAPDTALRRALDLVRRRKIDVRVVFLEASDEALVARYEAARRVHPMAREDRVVDGIARERTLLADLRSDASLLIDTTDLTVHDLRDRLVDAFADGDGGMSVTIVTFGHKNGTPRDLDLQLDVRFLPNPHWIDDLRPLTGLEAPVRDYVLGQPDTAEFLSRTRALFDFLVPAFQRESKHYLTVGIGCTGGKHRSVVLGEVLADHLRTLGVGVRVDHRDRCKE